MKYFISLFAFLFLMGCSSQQVKEPICNLQKSIAATVADTVASALACSNKEQISADIMSKLGKANLCAASATGVIGDVACPVAINALSEYLRGEIPASWSCTVDDTSGLAKLLLEACKGAVPFKVKQGC